MQGVEDNAARYKMHPQNEPVFNFIDDISMGTIPMPMQTGTQNGPLPVVDQAEGRMALLILTIFNWIAVNNTPAPTAPPGYN